MKILYFMKNTLLSIAIIFLTLSAYGQSVVISESGGAVPNSNAILDIQSDSKGILIPRLTKVQREGITTPPDGLLVFDTTEKAFFLYGNTKWTDLSSSAEIWSQDASNV